MHEQMRRPMVIPARQPEVRRTPRMPVRRPLAPGEQPMDAVRCKQDGLAAGPPVLAPPPAPLIQRKCAACAKEEHEQSPEGKLAVSHTDDPLDREADRVADRVMRMAGPKTERLLGSQDEQPRSVACSMGNGTSTRAFMGARGSLLQRQGDGTANDRGNDTNRRPSDHSTDTFVRRDSYGETDPGLTPPRCNGATMLGGTALPRSTAFPIAHYTVRGDGGALFHATCTRLPAGINLTLVHEGMRRTMLPTSVPGRPPPTGPPGCPKPLPMLLLALPPCPG